MSKSFIRLCLLASCLFAVSACATDTATLVPPNARTVSVLGSGDVLIHPPLTYQAHADAVA